MRDRDLELLLERHPADHLSRADISIKQIGALLDDVNAQKPAPRMPDQDNLVLVQMGSQILDQLDAILVHPLDCHGWSQPVSTPPVAPPRPPLSPLHICEMLFPLNPPVPP